MMHVIINYNDLPENILDYAAQYDIVRQNCYIKVKDLNESIFKEVKNCFVLIDDDAYTNYYLNYGIRTYVTHPSEEPALYKKVFERSLSAKNALIACIGLWERVKQTRFSWDKLPSEKWDLGGLIYAHWCPMCEYTIHELGFFDYRICHTICPLNGLWPNGCEETDTSYSLAKEAYENKDIELFQMCDEIIDACKEALNA